MWVPLIENGEADRPGADYFVKEYCDEVLAADPEIDTLLLGCTHYPILYPKIRQYLPERIRVVPQGELVADSLADYLERHPEMAARCSRGGSLRFMTTESAEKFDRLASIFLSRPVSSERVSLS